MHTFAIVIAEIIILFSLKLTCIWAICLSIAQKRPSAQTDGLKVFAAKETCWPFNVTAPGVFVPAGIGLYPKKLIQTFVEQSTMIIPGCIAPLLCTMILAGGLHNSAAPMQQCGKGLALRMTSQPQ